MKKAIALLVVLVLALSAASCENSRGGLPNGTYKPVAVTIPGLGRVDDPVQMMAYSSYAMIINGNKFTFKYAEYLQPLIIHTKTEILQFRIRQSPR